MTNQAFPALSDENDGIALIDGDSRTTYRQLNARIHRLATGVLGGKSDLEEERVALLAPAGADYVTALHGIWRAGGIAVPINTAAAGEELEHYLSDAGITRVIVSGAHPVTIAATELCDRLEIPLLTVEKLLAAKPEALPEIEADRRAMIVFTSGTSSRPKGVVMTHKAICTQITMLIDAWRWRASDVIPLFLPLHHFHGIINILSCALWCGATVYTYPRLDVAKLCEQVAEDRFTLMMAVPTIYVKLAAHLKQLAPEERAEICAGFGRMRVNISGSSACPVRVFKQWRALTGQTLLERYGMTEIGMAISNPYDGERRAGSVGRPLPGVTVQLFDENDDPVVGDGVPGEIRVKGDSVLKEYWNNELATRESFNDGWFSSGDIAVLEDGYYRIMGRSSIDIIKSGGYKLSALEIESVLQDHEAVDEVAVIGVPDDIWGESVAAAVTLTAGANLDLAELREWCAGKMSAYKIPRRLKVLDALPRNPMGKVIKTALRDLHFPGNEGVPPS